MPDYAARPPKEQSLNFAWPQFINPLLHFVSRRVVCSHKLNNTQVYDENLFRQVLVYVQVLTADISLHQCAPEKDTSLPFRHAILDDVMSHSDCKTPVFQSPLYFNE